MFFSARPPCSTDFNQPPKEEEEREGESARDLWAIACLIFWLTPSGRPPTGS